MITGKPIYNFCSFDVKNMKIGVPKEVYVDEKRVSCTPEAA